MISNNQPIRVSVIPPTPAFNQNALFESRRFDSGSHSPNVHWVDCFAEVYKEGKAFNVVFGTADVMPKEDADVLVYMTQPDSPKEVLLQKQRCPNQKAVLLIMETALGARYALSPRNHTAYDAVFTYVSTQVDNKRYFFYPPRAYYRHRITNGLPFGQRKVACLVGTNRVGLDGGFPLRTGVFAMKRGWRFSVRDWIDYVFCPGELIRFRAEVGRACATYRYDGFDVFGEGWDLLPETRAVCLGIPNESTLTYLGKYRYYFAFENHTSEYGLISERIWDALWGDAVPVYRGHTGIDHFVPADCYVDARQFKNPMEMLDWLYRTPEGVWETYHTAGRDFIRSKSVEKFLPDAFATRFVREIVTVAGRAESITIES